MNSSQTTPPTPRFVAPALRSAVFLSGFASLIYEIVWIKHAQLAFGATSTAMATVLAVYLAGLGLGGAVAGRYSAAVVRPFWWCAVIEFGLGLFGYVSPNLFNRLDELYDSVYRFSVEGSSSLLWVRFALVALALLPPAALMGSTLPMVCRYSPDATETAARKVGTYYALNTLGAVVGCFTAGFLLLPTLGVLGTTGVAATVNGICALLFAFLARATVADTTTMAAAKQDSRSVSARLAVLFVVIGLVAMMNEVLWARLLANVIRNTVYTYTLSLGVTLLGIAVGSWFGGALAQRWHSHTQRFLYLTWIIILLSVVSLGIPMLPARLWWLLSDYGYLPLGLALFPAACLSGMLLPLVCRLAMGNTDTTSATLGYLLAANCLGGVVGALAAGLWLLPVYGLSNSFSVTVSLGLSAAIMALCVDRQVNAGRVGSKGWGASTLGIMLTGLMVPVLAEQPIIATVLGREDKVLAVDEGQSATLAIVERGGEKSLWVNQAWQGSEGKTHQIMAAHVPMLHKPDSRSILTIGLGVGQTASRFLLYDITRLDIVDIEPHLFDFVRSQFPSRWLDDARVRLIEEDGRNYVRHSASRYDVISVEVGQVYRPGVDAFYTQEFYAEARSRLNAGGLIAQFVPLQLMPPREFASVIKTFLSIYPEASLWYNTSELLLLGWKDQRLPLQVNELRQQLARPALSADLTFHYWGGADQDLKQLANFLAGFLATGTELQRLAIVQGSTIYTDDKPRLAYAVSGVGVEDRWAAVNARTIEQHLSPLRMTVSGPEIGGERREFIAARRLANLGDIRAVAWLDFAQALQQLGDGRSALAAVDEALQQNPNSLRALQLKAAAVLATEPQQAGRDYLRRILALDPGNAFAKQHQREW